MRWIMSKAMLAVSVAVCLILSACAGAERIASPETDGCKVALKVFPDRPRATFDSELSVQALCPDQSGAFNPLAGIPTLKIFSEGDTDRQVLPVKQAGEPGWFTAQVVFTFGGRYLVTYDSGESDKPVHRLFSLVIEGPPDGGGGNR